MFHTPKDIADTHERICAAEAEGSLDEISDADAAMNSSYLELVYYIPTVLSLRHKVNTMDVLHHDVSCHLNHHLFYTEVQVHLTVV